MPLFQLAVVLLFQELLRVCMLPSVLGSDEFCVTTGGGVRCVPQDDVRLNRIDGKLVGAVQDITDETGRGLRMKTLSMKPLILEIPRFLTTEESKYFIQNAKEQGLKDSVTVAHKDDKNFQLMDRNADRRLDVDEMKSTIQAGFDVYLDSEDILKMYNETGWDMNNDGYITPDEINKFHPKDMKKYINEVLRTHPEKHSRLSKQTWLYPDKSTEETFTAVQKRVAKITNLPLELMKMSDFQVVSYGVKGHYNAHHDSTSQEHRATCCTREVTQNCKICRYMTVLFYLNDVEEGGETAFPFANNDTFNKEEVASSMTNLYKHCQDANLRVYPEEGKAVMWYNHFINDENGWLGELDELTYHGGCPVIRGTKWIANFWIKTTNDKLADLKKMHKFYKMNPQWGKNLTKHEL